MNELFIDAKFKGTKEKLLTLSFTSSGFLGIKKDIIYFSPNLMFFEEKEILAQIMYKDNTLIVKPQVELEMHFNHLKNVDYEDTNILKLRLRRGFENFMIGDDLYIFNDQYSFCMLVSKETVKLNKVAIIEVLQTHIRKPRVLDQ